ncbi:MAG: hypothetical protein KGY99_02890 [Phycisphaerae bacterium]|nr:hypothetical protein [Phycisphaerae bacterium]
MKVAIVSEGPTDEATVRALAEAVLSEPIETVKPAIRRSPGIDKLLELLPLIYKSLYYGWQADGLIVVVDSNASAIHAATTADDCGQGDCRLCLARRALRNAAGAVDQTAGRKPLHWAVGLAVPAIEAWCLCAPDNNVSENTWIQGMEAGQKPYTRRELKRRLYGPQPWPEGHTVHAIQAAMETVTDNVALLLSKFPVGFGALRSDLSQWGA